MYNTDKNINSKLSNIGLKHESSKIPKPFQLPAIHQSKTQKTTSKNLLITFISDKNKMKLNSNYDQEGSKNFLESKNVALREMKLSDEIIVEKPLVKYLNIISNTDNTNINTTPCSNATNECASLKLLDNESNKALAEESNDYERKKSKRSTIKSHKSIKSKFSEKSEKNLGKEGSEKIKGENKKAKRLSRFNCKSKSKFCSNIENKEEEPASPKKNKKSNKNQRKSAYIVGDSKTFLSKDLAEKFGIINKKENEYKNDEDSKSENKDEKEDKISRTKNHKSSQKLKKNIISIINKKEEESDIMNSTIENMIKELKMS